MNVTTKQKMDKLYIRKKKVFICYFNPELKYVIAHRQVLLNNNIHGREYYCQEIVVRKIINKQSPVATPQFSETIEMYKNKNYLNITAAIFQNTLLFWHFLKFHRYYWADISMYSNLHFRRRICYELRSKVSSLMLGYKITIII